MSTLRIKGTKRRREPTIALINVVFLMLVFFMVAGTLGQTIPRDLKLVALEDLDQEALPPVLLVFKDGRVEFQGHTIDDPATWATSRAADLDEPIFDILPDRTAPAAAVLRLSTALRQVPGARVRLITERALQ